MQDMSNEAYHAHPAIGSSGLKLIQQSPLHYWSRYLDPQREPDESTPAQRLGTAWHASIFEPDQFALDYIAIPEGLDRRTKEGKELFASIEASGKEPIKHDDFLRIARMTESARQHPVSQVVFDLPGGVAEASIFWEHPTVGVTCKLRPDYMVAPCEMFPTGLIIDGKTGEDMSPEGFAKYAWNWDLFLQAAFYCDGFMRHHGTIEPPAFCWLAQEKSDPFATAYYSASEDVLAYGRRKYTRLLNIYAECLRSDKWPGYPATVQPIDLPAWAAKQVSEGVAA